MPDLFADLDRQSDDSKIIHAPFGYPGGKTWSAKEIIKHLPYNDIYVEPFGGSAAVMLARHPSKLEVFNDRYAGVVAFYRCIRDAGKLEALIQWLDCTIHSREEWHWCSETWETEEDVVIRAAKWLYMTKYSFSQIGRHFGRAVKCNCRLAGRVRDKLPEFYAIHNRFKYVQVENLDWYDCLVQYDSPTTVFYLDPPYVETKQGAYKHTMSHDDHRRLLSVIFSLEGFVAISGYPNPIYDNQSWDDFFEWEVRETLAGTVFNEGNKKKALEFTAKRPLVKERLWIKE